MSILRTIKANAKSGGALGLRIASAAFVVDAVVLTAGSWLKGLDPLATAVGVLIAAGAYGIFAVALAALLAIVAAYVGGGNEIGAEALVRVAAVRRALGMTDTPTCRSFAARSVAVLLAFVAAAAAAVPISLAATADIRTPLYAAAVACAVAFGALAASAVAWPVWLRTGTLLARITPWIPRPAIQLGTALCTAAAVGAMVIAATWSSVGFALPWRGPTLALAFFAAGIAWFAVDPFSRRPRPAVRRALLAVRVILPIAGLTAAALLPRSLSSASALLGDATGPIEGIHGLAGRLLDFDRDGYLSILGQGDCAPFDGSRNPAVRDVPNDGIDQNCSGSDRTTAIVLAKARHDYPATPAPRPMPVVIVTIDSVSAADLDLYGAQRKTMPALARWARSAVVFDRAFSVGPSTRLSLPAFVTGRYLSSLRYTPRPQAHGNWAKGNVTLADMLGRAGYRTIADAPVPYFSKTLRWVYQGFSEVLTDPAKGLPAPRVTDAVLDALRSGTGKDRIFVWAYYADAHLAGKDYAVPPGMQAFPGGTPKDEHDTKLLYIDQQIDRLFAGLAEIFGDAPRLVIVTADHGESFDATHAMKAKARHAWDLSTSVTRVPLIVWSPYGTPRRTARIANTVDIVPTVLNALGLTARGLDGDSLLPTLLHGTDPGRPILQQMFFPEFLARGKRPLAAASVRGGDLVLHKNGATHTLFDYVRDPGEERDLFATRADAAGDLAEVMEEMAEESAQVDNARR